MSPFDFVIHIVASFHFFLLSVDSSRCCFCLFHIGVVRVAGIINMDLVVAVFVVVIAVVILVSLLLVFLLQWLFPFCFLVVVR